MAGTAIKNAGTKIFISAAPGAAATVLIDGITDISSFGVSRKDIDVTSLSDKWRRNIKGLKDGGKVDLTGQWRRDDRGQQLLKQAVDSDAAWGFRVELPDSQGNNGSKWEFQAQIMSYEPGTGKVDGVVEFKRELMVDNAIQLHGGVIMREVHGAHAEIFEIGERKLTVRRTFDLICRIEERFGLLGDILRSIQDEKNIMRMPIARLFEIYCAVLEDHTIPQDEIKAHIVAKGPLRAAIPIARLLMNMFVGDERFAERFEALQASGDRPDPHRAALSHGANYSERPQN